MEIGLRFDLARNYVAKNIMVILIKSLFIVKSAVLLNFKFIMSGL